MNLLNNSNNKRILICFILCLNIFSLGVSAQAGKYTVSNAHAHNDYMHPVPFYTAYNAGFGSIEADIFPVNGILCVAHSKSEIQPQRTLKSLYLDPLLHELAVNNSRRLTLLVDVKENYKLSLQLLIQEIEPLKQYLSTPQESRYLIILISGNRPPPAEYKDYPAFIFFDDDLKLHHSPNEWNRVGLVSLPFNKISDWKGEDDINSKDKKRFRCIIDSVQSAGKHIRFWAAPDNETSWKMQMKLGVDLIGTDKIDELANFLRRRSKMK
jgi:Glycerophosphoryl diester phosphodiesterase family